MGILKSDQNIENSINKKSNVKPVFEKRELSLICASLIRAQYCIRYYP